MRFVQIAIAIKRPPALRTPCFARRLETSAVIKTPLVIRGMLDGTVAQTATIYTIHIDLADMDRGVYETLDLRVARHPSESAEYMLTRVLAYCLEYQEGLEFTEGVSSADEPALVVRDLTGRVTAWIEVGMPDAARLHRGSKLAGRVAVYTHRDPRQLLVQLEGEKIHHAREIPIYTFHRAVIDDLAALIGRRASLALSVTDREIYISMGERSFTLPIVEHRIPG